MSRRRSPHLLLALIVLTACGRDSQGAHPPEQEPAPQPAREPYDVLFLAVDDLRDWVGALGTGSGAHTPNIDRLAARGMLFRSAHCPAPLCNPSRTAILTGVAPHVSGVYTNDQDWRPRLPQAVALPRYFREHGYRAEGAGKLFHDAFRDDSVWDEYLHGGPSAQPPFAQQPLNGLAVAAHFDWGPVDKGLGSMRDWRVADWAREHLSREREQPLFLGVGFYRPHLPWYVPKEFFDSNPLTEVHLPPVRENDLDDVPAIAKRWAQPDVHQAVVQSGQWEIAIQAYLACIEFADRCVGRVLDALDASPRRERTIVVLWSDHGWHLGEKEHWRKSTLWEEATRVPLIVVVPGLTEPGSICDEPVSLSDLYPTLLELCSLPPRGDIAGQSLVPQLRDPRRPRTTPALTTHGEGNHSLRSKRWRLTRYADGSTELYDHDLDPHEWTNLATDGTQAELIRELSACLPSGSAPDTGPDPKPGRSGATEEDD